MTTLVVVLTAAVGAVGALVLTRTPDDTVSHADAAIVLGGEHDGREESSVCAWPSSTMCLARQDGIEVICQMPTPSTTRGEAQMVKRLAPDRDWQRIVVVTWRYHLVCARYIFSRYYPIKGARSSSSPCSAPTRCPSGHGSTCSLPGGQPG